MRPAPTTLPMPIPMPTNVNNMVFGPQQTDTPTTAAILCLYFTANSVNVYMYSRMENKDCIGNANDTVVNIQQPFIHSANMQHKPHLIHPFATYGQVNTYS